ncbi:TolC family protein [Marinilongibacter aquaticus]|uniref:TolC family protein n=1 Tax=Marinilongibacter aquaticus TaxID=2975157 RepID=UPI0021BD7081|nr:TolC family protein [Marinilongibacter aquaticus]UBM60595.1 TolC family protein [Marinilongibacter aquaticus]
MNKLLITLCCMLVSLGVWAQSPDTQLSQAVEAAIAHSKAVETAKTGVALAKSEQQTVKDARLPEISASGQFMYLPIVPNLNLKFQQEQAQQSSGESGQDASQSQGFPVPKTLELGMVSASLPLYTGGKLKNNLLLSEEKTEASKISLNIQREAAAMQAIQLYTGIYKVKETLKLLEQNLHKSENRIHDFENFVENGLLAQNDLLKAKLQYSNIELSKEETLNQLSNLTYRLNKLTDSEASRTWDTENLMFDAPQIVPADLNFSLRKDLALYRQNNKMAKMGIALSKGNYFPTVALSAGYIAANISQVATITNAVNLGVAVKYNISSLYKNQSEVKVAQLKLAQAESKFAEAEEKASVEVQEAKNQLNLTAKKVDTYNLAITQAEENLRIITNKHKNGLADTDQLLEADLQYLQAKINQKAAKADQLLAWYQLSYASGNLLDYFQIK